jgi:hypothetical protein
VRLRIIHAIAVVTWRSWFNGLVRSVGSRAAARATLGGIGALLAGWLVFGTWSLRSLGQEIQLNAELGALLTVPVAGIVFVMPALATVASALYTPDRTVISRMLAVLPLRESDRESATRWIVVVLGVVFGSVWAAPLALQFLMTGSPAAGIVAAAACLLVAFCGALVAQVMLAGAELVAIAALGRRSTLTRALAGLVTMLLLAAVYFASLPAQGRAPSGPIVPLGQAVGWSMQGWDEGGLQVVALVILPTALVLTMTLLSRVPIHLLEWRRSGTTGRTRWPPARTLVGLETRQWLRFPNNAVMLVVVGGVAVASLTVWRASFSGSSGVLGVYLILTLIGTLGVGSFGPTRAHHWIYLLLGRPLAWVVPKLVSVLLIWASVAGIYLTTLSISTGWSPGEAVTMMPLHLIELAAGCVVGILLPVTREQSFGGAISESVAIVVVVSVSTVIQQLPLGGSAVALVTGYALMIAGVLAGYVWAARAQMQRLRATHHVAA